MGQHEHSGKTIVFVGRRSGATVAAKALGLRTLTITDGLADEPNRRRWARPFYAPSAVTALAPVLAKYEPAAVLSLSEGSVLPASHLRAALGLSGQGVSSALRCTDKVEMKRAVRAAGIPCTDWVSDEDGLTADELVERLGLPLVVKARASSGSRGTRIVRERRRVPGALPPGWMAEALVTGTEMSVESLVVDGEPVFENPTEYFRPGWANILPREVEPAVWTQVRDVTRRAITALGVGRGLTHCEVFLTDRGVVFGEMASRPPGGHLMELLRRAYGFDAWEALLRIGLGERPELAQTAARHAGVWLFHPGRGRIGRVTGVETARTMPGVVDLPFWGNVGRELFHRIGVGQEVGHVTVVGPTRADVARDLLAAHDAVTIDLDRSAPLPTPERIADPV